MAASPWETPHVQSCSEEQLVLPCGHSHLNVSQFKVVQERRLQPEATFQGLNRHTQLMTQERAGHHGAKFPCTVQPSIKPLFPEKVCEGAGWEGCFWARLLHLLRHIDETGPAPMDPLLPPAPRLLLYPCDCPVILFLLGLPPPPRDSTSPVTFSHYVMMAPKLTSHSKPFLSARPDLST